AEDTAGLPLEGLGEGFRIEARQGDIGPEPIDQQRSQCEPEALLQVFRLREGREVQIRGELFRCRSHALSPRSRSGGDWRPAPDWLIRWRRHTALKQAKNRR